jgi:pimeloyl-ACP methyl ester carboxylesterase
MRIISLGAAATVLPMSLASIAVCAFVLACLAITAVCVGGLFLVYPLFINAAVPGSREEPEMHEGEPATFESEDGASLEGRLVRPEQPSTRTIIFCHEAGSSMASLRQYGWFLVCRGFNVFTFNFRAEARGAIRRARPWVTDQDVNDLQGAIRYVRSRFDLRPGELGLLGISRGGSVALCAGAANELVGAVVADGGFDTRTTVEMYIRKWTPRYVPLKRLPKLIYVVQSYALLRLAGWRLGCRFHSVKRAISHSRRLAVFFVHGKGDQYVPSSHAVELYRRARRQRKRELWLVPDSGHNCGALQRKDEYSRRVSEFFERNLVDRTSKEPR